MLRMEKLGQMLARKQGGAAGFCHRGVRLMVSKAANRAAVHGSKLPVPSIIPEKEVRMEIHRAKEEKGKEMRKMEDILESHLKNWKLLYVEDIVSSK